MDSAEELAKILQEHRQKMLQIPPEPSEEPAQPDEEPEWT